MALRAGLLMQLVFHYLGEGWVIYDRHNACRIAHEVCVKGLVVFCHTLVGIECLLPPCYQQINTELCRIVPKLCLNGLCECHAA